MNTTTVTVELPRTRSRDGWRPRLVTAEFLKLRKRRGLVLSTLALTVVPIIVGYTVLLILHATDPARRSENAAAARPSGVVRTAWTIAFSPSAATVAASTITSP